VNGLSDLTLYVISLLALAYVLIKVANIVIGQLEYLDNHTHFQSFGLAAVLAAISTSMPELIVAITSAVDKNNSLTLGNIMGSNITNISLTLGLAAVIGGSIKSSDQLIKREVMYAFLIGALPNILLTDGNLSRLDGLILIAAYVLYVINQMFIPRTKRNKETMAAVKKNNQSKINRLHHWAKKSVWRHAILFIASAGIMVLSGEMLVKTAVLLAHTVNVPLFLVGLVVVSLGTTLPELAFSIKAATKRQSNLAFGNIIGSIVVNGSLILGISAYINPIYLQSENRSYLLSVLGFVTIFALFWRFVWTKHRLDRHEGALLMLIYSVFVVVQYIAR
jgi:cation:H+ antiporter